MQSKGDDYAVPQVPGLKKVTTMKLNENTGLALRRGDSLAVNFNAFERKKTITTLDYSKNRSVQKRRDQIFD